jgi:hypothetical protein
MASNVLGAIQGIIDAFSRLSLSSKVLLIVFIFVLGIFFGNPLINPEDHSKLADTSDTSASAIKSAPESKVIQPSYTPSPPYKPVTSSGNTLWALYKGQRLTELTLPLNTALTLELSPPFGGYITEYQQFSGRGAFYYLNTNIPQELGYSSGETVRTQFMVGLTGDYEVWYTIVDSSNKAIYESNHITISSP